MVVAEFSSNNAFSAKSRDPQCPDRSELPEVCNRYVMDQPDLVLAQEELKAVGKPNLVIRFKVRLFGCTSQERSFVFVSFIS